MSPPVVVITGASAGVGRATAREYARGGAKLGLIARGEDALKAACGEAQGMGAKAIYVTADVADFEDVEAAAKEVETRLGPIDVWINNAMTSVFSPVKQMKPEEYRRVSEVTYLGYVHGTLAALKLMLPRDRGTIVQVGSALAYRGIPLQSAYCAAKHAIKGFTESLRCELLHDSSGVMVTMVNLPAMNTPQFEWVRSRLSRHPRPVPPIYQPEIAAKAVMWAADHPRRQLNVAGVTSATIWANKLFPALIDRYLSRTNYEAQQTDYPPEPNRKDNLFEPVPGDLGPHGRFDEQAKTTSVQLWLNTHRLLAGGVGAAAAVLGAIVRRTGD
jgi:NAD(P)-dependent dehydrogenase (short-subunit alcohol dehydrogenase family)